MPIVSAKVTADGLTLVGDAITELGLGIGEDVRLEIRHAPDEQAIRRAAMRYAWRRLGDAVGIGEPRWVGDAWAAAVYVPGCSDPIGELVVSPDATVDEDASTSKEELLRSLHAASACVSPG